MVFQLSTIQTLLLLFLLLDRDVFSGEIEHHARSYLHLSALQSVARGVICLVEGIDSGRDLRSLYFHGNS